MQERSAKGLWEAALGQLQLQVTRPNYETWLRDTVGVSLGDGLFTIAAPSDFAVEWLSTRLHGLIAKTLSSVVGHPVKLAFAVAGAPPVPQSSQPAPPPEPPYPSLAQPPFPKPRLNPLLTFGTFTVAGCNRLAHAAALAVAENSGAPTHNPLFLYSESGLGKTHLMHATGHELVRAGLRVLYTTAEQFTSEFVQAARQRRMEEFRAKYRSLDAFLLDDIQFLAGKEQTQEEFFHTFNDLHTAGKQLILSSDQPPQALSRFSNRLRSRLHWGLTADLAPPPLKARLAILTAKAANLHAEIDPAALEFLARHPCANVRELEGALNRVLAYARLTEQSATAALAKDALHQDTDRPVQRPIPAPDAIIDAVCSHFDVSRQALHSKARSKRVATARHVAMYLLRHDAYQPLTQIGRILGDRDHSTVLYACRKVEREAAVLPQAELDITAIRQLLASPPAV
jgi:chromosomal replication initiator protein